MHGLTPLSQALVLSSLSQRTRKPLLVVFGSRAEARNACDNLAFFLGRDHRERTHYIPSIDFDFHRGLLPNPEIFCEKNTALFHALNDPTDRIFVTTLGALLQKVVPAQEYLASTLVFKSGDEVDRDGLIQNLFAAGYQKQPAATDPGIFSVRGGVVDIFCPLYRWPIRLEFFGDFIEEMRQFDPESQRSLEKQEQVSIIPVGHSLIPRADKFDGVALKIKDRLDQLGVPKPRREEILEGIRDSQLSAELGFLFPLLSGGSTQIFEYFTNPIVVWGGRQKLRELTRDKELPALWKHLELFEKEPHPIASKHDLFLSLEELEEHLSKGLSFEEFASSEKQAAWTITNDPLSLAHERSHSTHKAGGHALLESFARRFREWIDEGYRVHVICHTRTHADRFRALFETYGFGFNLQPEGTPGWPALANSDFSRLNLWVGFITESERLKAMRLVLLSEEEIFGQKKRVSRSPQSTASAAKLLSRFRDLKLNDFVVHKEHGIGKYLGLKSMTVQGVLSDFVLVEYRDGDKLYVPVYRLNLLQKYAASEGANPVLDKLGGDRWAKAKSKAQKAVAEVAAQLLEIQAKRKLVPAFAFSPPSTDFQEFEMTFPFDETPDQMKAIEAVMDDLSKPNPMDRLLCGDVGYGKTEVALRASYRAVLDGKQVAVLVPTTVLAFQHFETFKNRMKDLAVRVEMVSRLRSPKQIKQTLDQLKEGKVDIIIGTHRLLSSDVVFKDLQLVVVDEEHRFGVIHKEKLKKICRTVHVLAMTATPIPRTLNMSLVGIKDISIITTPPPDRLSVRTFVCRDTDEVLLEAIGNELTREGQVFFVHNRIQTIFELGERLKRLMPRLKLEVVHGQMDPEELERKMLAFYRGDFHLLLTTTIIESGLDIPRANTIIIDNADHLGLAQLYQLRGRVGRAERRAYCYLLAPQQMTEEGTQRLQVIQRYTDLGAGFSVASHDMEIRGTGDLLGEEQSGHITAIGVDMYFDLLEECLQSLRGEEKRYEIEPEINIKVAAYFPEAYLPDISERIAIYRRLSAVEKDEGISEVEEEIRDRFGNLPEEVNNLLGLMRLKLYLKKLHVMRLSSGPKRTSLQFAATTPASPEKLVKLIQSDPKRYSVTPDQKLVFASEQTDWQAMLREVERLANLLGVN